MEVDGLLAFLQFVYAFERGERRARHVSDQEIESEPILGSRGYLCSRASVGRQGGSSIGASRGNRGRYLHAGAGSKLDGVMPTKRLKRR